MAAYEILTKGRITTGYELKTKILTVMVEMPESKLAADVANAVVASLDKYVRTQRKSFATEQRKYLVSRVQQIKDTLTYCEDALKNFREKNRQVAQSPELLLEQNRLMRNVEIQQTISDGNCQRYTSSNNDNVRDRKSLDPAHSIAVRSISTV